MSKEEDIAVTLKKLDLIQRHISNVQSACNLLGRKLIERGEIRMGIFLIANSYLHDNSKLTSSLQFNYLFQTEDKDMLKLAITEHINTNDHHPDFYGGIEFMSRIKIAELVADLSARSAEQGTSLKNFLKEEYYPRYEITKNSRIDKYIKEFVDLLLDDKFEEIK